MIQQRPSLRLPRKRFLLIGIATAILLTYYTFLPTSIPTLSIPTSSRKCPANKTPPPKNAGKLSYHPIPTLMASSEGIQIALWTPPPDGFDLWWEYAKKEGHVLVDEYDEMMVAFGPLRKLGAKEARRRAEILLRFGFPYSIGGLKVGGEAVFGFVEDPEKKKEEKKQEEKKEEEEEDNGGYRTAGLLEMLEPLKEVLKGKVKGWTPFSIPVNELAEARVVGGDDEAWGTDALKGTKETYTPEDLWHNHARGARTLVDDLAKACGKGTNLASRGVSTRFEFGIEEVVGAVGGGLDGDRSNPDFVVDPNVDNDMCQRPELMTVHGVYRGTQLTTRGLFPMLSYGRPSAFSDIPIPSRYQWDEDGSYEYNPHDEIPWSQKHPVIYWHGEPSGGGHGDKYYGSMHRHRLVALTNPAHFKRNVTLIGASKSGHLIETTETGPMAQSLTNITFSEISGMCEMFGCELPSIFPFGPRNRFSEAWKNKLVIDSDGWGPSGRWRALVASQSVAIRSSAYREWFGQRMIPWVHYVPASVGLEELWGILGYFLGTADGGVPHDTEARKIAQQGAKWVEEHMRKKDMTVYCFRLVLELNRLFNGEKWVYKS
ncbi:hypothetical protein BDD12DRAFT_803731 [Trichophaea hybrida]|nr:hypothetical protein BDD12DRAFT_803731 [Trichophaea hybrida]